MQDGCYVSILNRNIKKLEHTIEPVLAQALYQNSDLSTKITSQPICTYKCMCKYNGYGVQRQKKSLLLAFEVA